MPLLADLEARFLKYLDDKSYGPVKLLREADGVIFLCPVCFTKNNCSNVGVHSVICWFKDKVPDTLQPGPGRWNPGGTGMYDLTFVPPGMTGVKLTNPDGCGWHGHIRNGEATLD